MERRKLGEICEIVSGSTPKTEVAEYWDGDINWITPAELTDETYIIEESQRKITHTAVQKTGLKPFPKGTVILSSRAPIGKVAIAGKEMYCNQGFKNFICSDKIDNRYLYWYLKGHTDYLNSLGRGATFKEISKGIVENIEIPLPDLDEQIVCSNMLKKCWDLILMQKKQIEAYDTLIKSRFVEMFGDLKKNDMSWPVYPFVDFAQIDTTMIHDFKEYGDYPHIGIDSIEKETGNISGYRTAREDGVISGKYLFTPDHIIYSKIRPNLNKVALPEFEGVCSADAYPILPKKGRCDRIFLAYTMRSSIFLDYILAFSNRTNLPKVNKVQVEGFCCPMPNIALQQEFAAFVRQVDKLKAEEQRGLEKTQTLFDSLMQQYFG